VVATYLSHGLATTPPRHVHVYRDGVLVVKWDLENQLPMRGEPSQRVRSLIEELKFEGLI